ncbi:MAG TPA: hypothetical protein VMV68_03890 [Spirochaetia bacterium]|nr:hypothetical protein [Spirochaetia bacterium]
MFIFWILVGIAVGYLFKPQIDKLIGRTVKTIRDNRDKDKF